MLRDTMILIKCFFAIMMMIPGISQALPADRGKTIEIESDTASIDNKNGVSIYQGNVIMVQGSTLLKGDTVTIYNDKNGKALKVISAGQRAYFEELQKNKERLKAWGETINYNVANDNIQIFINAELHQGEDIFKGDKIDYDIQRKTEVASGSPEKNGIKGRIKMVIQPRSE